MLRRMCSRAIAQRPAHAWLHAWWCALALYACAPTLPAGYVRARDAAERAYAAGQFSDAGQRWLDAAQNAGTARDRNEARYRAATSYERGGDLNRAGHLYSELARGKSERAARATFALADLRLQSGDTAGGSADLDIAIRKYPTSGVANLALRRYFGLLSAQGGDAAVLDYLARVEPVLDRTELAEQVLYERARRLDSLGRAAKARDAYVTVAQRFPYPQGAYWDDALFRGAECELRLGRDEAAIRLLESMLDAREASHLSGSYERPRFAEAAFRLAELYRDRRHDSSGARRAFRRVFNEFPTSTLRDDALWQEALLARDSGAEAACAPITLLVGTLPDSRYVPCAHEICPEIATARARECAPYIERAFASRTTRPKAEP